MGICKNQTIQGTQVGLVVLLLTISGISILSTRVIPVTASTKASSIWQQVGPSNLHIPNYGTVEIGSGHVGDILIQWNDPEVMYLQTGYGFGGPMGDGGIYKTTDGGIHWGAINLGLPLGIVTSLYLNQSNPNILLVGVLHHGIFRSYDGGGYWSKVSDFNYVIGFTKVGGKLLAGSFKGIVGSVDSGMHWTLDYPTSIPISAMSASGNRVYAGEWDVWNFANIPANQALLVSSDGGNTWLVENAFSFLPIGAGINSISASPFDPNVVYVCTRLPGSNSALQSVDGGKSFVSRQSPQNVREVLFDPSDNSKLWTIGDQSYSTDGGLTWSQGYLGWDEASISVNPRNDNMLVAGTDQGPYESRDSGVNWFSISGNLSDALVYNLGVGFDGKTIIASMQDYGSQVSNDGGISWMQNNPASSYWPPEGARGYVNPGNSRFVYAVGGPGSGLLLSTDAGSTFKLNTQVPMPTHNNFQNYGLLVDPYNTSQVFIAGDSGIYVSKDFGQTWKLMPGSPQDAATIAMGNESTIYAGSAWYGEIPDGIYVYNGARWSQAIGIPPSVGIVGSVSVDPGDLRIVVATLETQQGGRLFISYNGGGSFSQLHSITVPFHVEEGGDLLIHAEFLNTTGYPLIASTTHGVYLSTDLGSHWSAINYDMASEEVTQTFFTNDTLYVSTFGNGILKIPNFDVTRLPAIIDGQLPNGATSLTIDGTIVDSAYRHFRLFLAPGEHQIMTTIQGITRTISVSLSPMEEYSFGTPTTLVCNPATVPVGKNTTCRVTVMGESPTGLALWFSGSIGRFSRGSCSLVKGSCTVTYSPGESATPVTINATYMGDTQNFAQASTYNLKVTLSPSKTTLSCRTSALLTCTAVIAGYRPSGTVQWSEVGGTGSVSFSMNTCTLFRGRCSVILTGKVAGFVTVQATYSGDQNNLGSSKTRNLFMS